MNFDFNEFNVSKMKQFYLKKPNTYLFLILVFSTTQRFHAQILDNGSMEGEPLDASMPAGWFAYSKETTPDILPGPWGVTLEPSDGSTYVGLITRKDGSFESITQPLKRVMESNLCYKFNIDLSRSLNYAGNNEVISCNIYIASKDFNEKKIIFSIKKLEHFYWKTYEVKFKAPIAGHHIIIEAYYPDVSNKCAGNILIDNISPIFECDRV